MKLFKMLSVIVLAIIYVVMPWDFDQPTKFHHIVGYIDDFFFFMAAFMIANAIYHGGKPGYERLHRTFMLLGAAFVIMGAFSLAALALLA